MPKKPDKPWRPKKSLMLFFVVFPAVVEIVPFLVAGKAAVGVEEFGAFVEIVPLFSECLRAGAPVSYTHLRAHETS